LSAGVVLFLAGLTAGYQTGEAPSNQQEWLQASQVGNGTARLSCQKGLEANCSSLLVVAN
jgi:hypothetical protein